MWRSRLTRALRYWAYSYVRLTSGSYRLARRTAAFSLSWMTSSGTPPQCSNYGE